MIYGDASVAVQCCGIVKEVLTTKVCFVCLCYTFDSFSVIYFTMSAEKKPCKGILKQSSSFDKEGQLS